MPFPTGNYAYTAVRNRVMNAYWFGRRDANIAIAPIALNNEAISVVNAAGTGLVEVVRVNASDRVVFASGIASLALITANGAVNPSVSQSYIITKAGVAVLTLAAPVVTTDDGTIIEIKSSTAFAHTLTATGLFQTGAAAVNLATFAAQAGAGLKLLAYNGKWIVLASVGITFS